MLLATFVGNSSRLFMSNHSASRSAEQIVVRLRSIYSDNDPKQLHV